MIVALDLHIISNAFSKKNERKWFMFLNPCVIVRHRPPHFTLLNLFPAFRKLCMCRSELQALSYLTKLEIERYKRWSSR